MRFLLLLATIVFNTDFALAAEAANQRVVVYETHQPLPVIEFKDANGKVIALSDFKGHPVLLHFWATWCAPCVEELPGLARVQQVFGGKRGLIIVPISFDLDVNTVKKFYTDHQLENLPVYISATPSLISQLKLAGLPATLLVSPEGEEISRANGKQDWDRESEGIGMWLISYKPPMLKK